MPSFATPPTVLTSGRHRVAAPATRTMSTTTWNRVRAVLTATIVVAATVAGVTVGLGGATVSPVSVAGPATAAAGPVAVADDPGGSGGTGHGGHHHR